MCNENQMQMGYELVLALDKQSVLYLRPYKGDVFLTKQKRCHNCNGLGHIAKFCRSNNNRKPHNLQPSTSKVIQCYNCNNF